MLHTLKLRWKALVKAVIISLTGAHVTGFSLYLNPSAPWPSAYVFEAINIYDDKKNYIYIAIKLLGWSEHVCVILAIHHVCQKGYGKNKMPEKKKKENDAI